MHIRIQFLAASCALAHVAFLKQPDTASTWLSRETGQLIDHVGQGVSPKTTAAPGRPRYGGVDLFRRYSGYTMGTDTCGFINSYWSAEFTCLRIGASCTNDGTFIGCCTATGSQCFSIIKTACLDYTLYQNGACDSRTGYNTLCCSSTESPLCRDWVFSTTATPGRTLTLHDCDTTTAVGTLQDFPPALTRSSSSSPSTTSRTTTTSSSRTTTSRTSSTSSDFTTTSSSLSSTTIVAQTSPAAAASSSSSSSSSPSQSSDSVSSVGPIVGGVVGGLAVIGLVILGVVFMLRGSKKADSNNNSPNAPDTSQVPPPSGSSGNLLAKTAHSPSASGSPFSPHYSFHSSGPYTQQGPVVYAVPIQGQHTGGAHNSHDANPYGYPTPAEESPSPVQQPGWQPAPLPGQQYHAASYGEAAKDTTSPANSDGYDIPPQRYQEYPQSQLQEAPPNTNNPQ